MVATVLSFSCAIEVMPELAFTAVRTLVTKVVGANETCAWRGVLLVMIVAKAQYFMNEVAAWFISRVGLAGKDQLDGAPLVMEQPFQPFEIAEQQGRPLIGGKAPGEADGERFGVEPAKWHF